MCAQLHGWQQMLVQWNAGKDGNIQHYLATSKCLCASPLIARLVLWLWLDVWAVPAT